MEHNAPHTWGIWWVKIEFDRLACDAAAERWLPNDCSEPLCGGEPCGQSSVTDAGTRQVFNVQELWGEYDSRKYNFSTGEQTSAMMADAT